MLRKNKFRIFLRDKFTEAMFFNFSFTLKAILLLSFLFLPLSVIADMRSSSYIIRESVDYVYDGPIISSVSVGSTSSSRATITWTTSVVADGYVVYSVNADLSSSKEQGSSSKTSTSQSVTLVGLDASTTYYYEVRSTNQSSGTTQTSAGESFTTDAAPPEDTTTTTTGGGGILIIDKRDKVPPTISNIIIEEIGLAVKVSWQTDESSTSFVEYGRGITYGSTYGQWDSETSHQVSLISLLPGQTYNLRVLSSDASGNLAQSENQVIKTASFLDREEGDVLPEIIDESLTEESLLERLNIIERMASLLPGPIIVGEPRVEVYPSRVEITWSTDKATRSEIAIAPEASYRPGEPEPYTQIISDTDGYTQDHKVEIVGLEPGALYNYQVRMKTRIGPTIKTPNFTFRTIVENLIIDNYYIDVIDQERVRFRWVTNIESDSAVTFIPYLGEELQLSQSRTIRDNVDSVIHDITVEEFLPGAFYDIELLSVDEEGNIALERIKLFSTGVDNKPPVITRVRTNSTIFISKKPRAQTVVSWVTDEPATSKIYYLEGVHRAEEEWPQKTEVDDTYNKRHIKVFNDFKQGTIYSFRIEAADPTGNTSLSKVYTFITPKKRESIFQLIIDILEDLFGWLFKGRIKL